MAIQSNPITPQSPTASTITCPSCRTEFPLTDAVSHGIRESLTKEFAEKQQRQEQLIAEREARLRTDLAALEKGRLAVQEEVARKVAAEKLKLAEEARAQARAQVDTEFKDLQSQMLEQKRQLAEAQSAELDLRKQKRAIEEQKQQLELEVQRKLDEERGKIRELAMAQAADDQRLKMAEKEKLIGDMQKQIESLRQKAEQGSQQLQGEVLELELEQLLQQRFPHDEIIAVSTGQRGADIIHTVRTASGQDCGVIVWEAKRAKNWTAAWVPKLKENQRDRKAELGVIVSSSLPEGLKSFGQHENVWVTNLECALSLAAALRQGLMLLAHARSAELNKHGKMEQLYAYLSGTEFRQKIESMVESFVSMKSDLDTEKRAIIKAWNKREQQINNMIENTAALYGSVQGIVGQAALPEISQLQLE